jgi:hypothetical protein
MTTQDARERAARGVAYLDAHTPGWADRIDVGRLDMGRHCFCVLGQLHGQFSPAVEAAWPSAPFAQSIAHGFLAVGMDMGSIDEIEQSIGDEYRTLQDEWVRVIADRRLSPAQTPQPVSVAVRA